MHKSTLLPLLLLLSIGCGSGDDDNGSTEADAGDTTTIDAGTGNTADAMPAAENFAYVLGTDSTTSGILTEIAMNELTVSQGIVDGVVASDAVVRRFGNRLYIINRFGFDNITIVDIDTDQLVAQISTGTGTNPQDVAVIGDALYVCAYDSNSILVLDQTDEQAKPTRIDISSYDKDGVPNCNSIVAVDGILYATLGIIDQSFSSNGGKVVVIDSADNTITSDFDLTYNNPFGLLEATDPDGPFGGDLLVPTTEDFGPVNGCIERIRVGATPSSGGCLIENATLGGFSGKVQLRGDEVIVAVSTSFTEGKVVKVGADGALIGDSITPATQHVTDIAVCPSGDVLTNDGENGTIRVFGPDDAERTSGTGLDIGLPASYANALVCF